MKNLQNTDIQKFQQVLSGTHTENGNHPYYAAEISVDYAPLGGFGGAGTTKRGHVSLKPEGENFRLKINVESRNNTNMVEKVNCFVSEVSEVVEKVNGVLGL